MEGVKGEHFVSIKLTLTKDEPPIGMYVLGKLSLVQPGTSKTFKILMPVGQTSTKIELYNEQEENVGTIEVVLRQKT